MVVQHGGVCWGVSTPSAEGWFYGNLKNNFQVIESKFMSIIFCLRKDPLNPTNWVFRRSETHQPAPDSLLPSINAGGKIICPTSHVQQKNLFALLIFHLFHFLLCPLSAYYSFPLPLKCLISFFWRGDLAGQGHLLSLTDDRFCTQTQTEWKDTEIGSVIALVWAQWKLKFI